MAMSIIPSAQIEPGKAMTAAKRVRATVRGLTVVDTHAPLLVWEHNRFPRYFARPEEIAGDLRPAGEADPSPALGACMSYDLVLADGTVLPGAAQRYPQADDAAIRAAVGFQWSAFDTWLEEDEIVYVHARDPYTRIDIQPSSRHVVVRYRGELLADTRRPTILFETGLPPRFYLPRSDVRMDLLHPSTMRTGCPYKGFARYWSIVAGAGTLANAAWSYPMPLPEAIRVAGLISFWPEISRDLEIDVDDERI